MKKSIKTLSIALLAAAPFTNPLSAKAQIVYSSEGLSIEGAPKHLDYGLTIGTYGGMYWTCKKSNFFQLDVSPMSPRIAGTGNQIVFYNSETNAYNSIQVASVYNYSDARAKENIESLSSGLEKVLNLRPVTYKWKVNNDVSAAKQSSSTTPLAYGPKEDENVQYGFLAQEVEEVFPDAVKTDEEGRKLINYTAMIPVLVQSIQELQGTIEEQAATIATLKSSIAESNSVIGQVRHKIISCSHSSTNVTITYKLIGNATDAFMMISDLIGNQEKRINSLSGKECVSVDVSDLKAGIHVVTLIVNNHVKDSKQIVISR